MPLRAGSAVEFESLGRARAQIDVDDVDYSLLAEAVYHETNRRRLEHERERLTHRRELDMAACGHAEAMVEEDFFSHQNPRDESLATPANRVRAQGLELGFVAENIGEVFALRYETGEPVYVRREDGAPLFSPEPGGDPLGARSYLEIAQVLLDGWMASEGHRKNVLDPRPRSLGAACHLTRDEILNMPMFRCVQLFFRPR